MKLTLGDISAHQINWHDKASNLVTLSEQLNINLDSMVFIDDSEFEVNLINDKLPQVTTIWLDKNKPVDITQKLKTSILFEQLSITSEDSLKADMYQHEIQREDFKKNNIDDYLSALQLKMEINIASKIDAPRVSQQTQKTNQFNLTTKRYSESDINQFIEQPNVDVLTIRVEDKFGDMGRVGSAIIKYHEKNVEIDTFLLSCRALGRKVERSFLYEIIKFCEYKGVKEVTCSYEKTSRNMQTEFFYDDNYFTCLSSNNEGKKYSMPIINIGINPIDFISIDNTNIYENR